jgi:hypothetical protein
MPAFCRHREPTPPGHAMQCAFVPEQQGGFAPPHAAPTPPHEAQMPPLHVSTPGQLQVTLAPQPSVNVPHLPA